MRTKMRRTVRHLAIAIGSLLLCHGAQADVYPSRPIQLVVPYPPGASTDTLARKIAQKMSETLGQPVVIQNKGGASGAIGTEFLSRAEPDGYTLGIGNPSTHTLPVALGKKTPYDPVNDFTPISSLVNNQVVLAVNPQLPVKSVSELLDYARKNPTGVSFSSPGYGTSHHLFGEMLNESTGINMLHVSYRGGGPAITDLVGGQVPIGVASVVSIRGLANDGKVRILCVLGEDRLAGLPGVETIREVLPEFNVRPVWTGIFAPAGLPDAIADRLTEAVVAAVRDPETNRFLEENGLAPVGSTRAEFAKILADDIESWGAVVRSRNLTGE